MDKTKPTTCLKKTIKVGSVTVNIHQPILTDTERKRREADIVSVLGRYARILEGVKNND